MGSFVRLRFKHTKPDGIGRLEPQTEGARKKREFLWWPTETAMDRQKIEVGVPFFRKGEWVRVWRDEDTGALKSEACSPPRKSK